MHAPCHLFITSCFGLTIFACTLDEPHPLIILGGPDGGTSVTAGTTTTTGSSTGAAGSTGATTATTTTAATTSAATTSSSTTATATTGAGGTGGSGAGGSGGSGGGPGGPTGISLLDPTNSEITPGMGGSEFTHACPDGEALTSFSGTWGGPYMGLESLQAACAKIAISGSAPYQVTFMPSGNTVGPFGEVSPETADGPCPDGQAVVGFEGRSGDWIDQLTFHCAPLTISDVGGSYTVEVGTSAPMTTPIGPSTGSEFPSIVCPTSKIAVGIVGRSGAAIDAFGLTCATPTLTTMRR